MVTKVRVLVNQQGALPTVNPSDDILEKVREFYYKTDISREMPGMRDVKSVKGNYGIRELKQKRLFLCTLREGYQLFKKEHPDCKVEFSAFASLRPQEVILAGASGTHSVFE